MRVMSIVGNANNGNAQVPMGASMQQRQQHQQGRDPSEVLIFRDYTGWEEPALSTPFGFWSLRNVMVLVVFGLIAGAAYSAIVPDDMSMEQDWLIVCVALAPLGLGVLFASLNTPFGSSDAIVVALVVLAIGSLMNPSSADMDKGKQKSNQKSQQGRRRRQKSKVLGIPRHVDADADTSAAEGADSAPLEITCADFDELKSIKVTIYGGDGYAYANRMVSCHIDDELVDMMRTSSDGSLVLHVRPERSGGRMLVVRSAEKKEHGLDKGDMHDNDDMADPHILLAKPLFFVRSGGGDSGQGTATTTVASILSDDDGR